MTGAHPDLGPELRKLAQTVLDRLDPAVRAAATAAARGDGPGRCQQVWCPVCALAALVTGEQHPLLSVVAEHSVGLMTMLRAMVQNLDTPDAPPPPSPPPSGADGEPLSPTGPGRYQHIPVRVEE